MLHKFRIIFMGCHTQCMTTKWHGPVNVKPGQPYSNYIPGSSCTDFRRTETSTSENKTNETCNSWCHAVVKR
jgi:hypothetical protein